MSEDFIKWYEDNIEEIVTRYEVEYPEIIKNNGYWEDYIDIEDILEYAKELYQDNFHTIQH